MAAAYEVRIETVAPRPLAVAHGAGSREALADTILGLLGRVWTALRAQGIATGYNVVVYPEGGLMNIDAGVEVSGPFTANESVRASATPAGETATSTFWGEYAELGEVHAAVDEWCAAHGRQPAGPRWEVYGDWHADPKQRRTDVYVLLTSA